MLEDFATEVAGSVKNSDFKIDPITILAIISVIVTIWRACRPSQSRINKPSFIDRWRLRRVVRDKFKGTNTPNKKYAQEVYEALLNKGAAMSELELEQLAKSIEKL